MNEDGHLNLARFEKFLAALSEKEFERFDDIYSDSKWLEGKKAQRTAGGRHSVKSTPGPSHVQEMLSGVSESTQDDPNRRDSDLQQLLNSADEFLLSEEEEEANEDEEDTTLEEDDYSSSSARGNNYQMEFRQHKRDYYIHKLGYSKVDGAVLREQALTYVRAIQWNLSYYYHGCVSWSWYYPHHFAPWISDIRGFTDMKMDLEMSRPFLPFQQLLAVLPAASKELLPPVRKHLFCRFFVLSDGTLMFLAGPARADDQ